MVDRLAWLRALVSTSQLHQKAIPLEPRRGGQEPDSGLAATDIFA
jgi:hypothetical protein